MTISRPHLLRLAVVAILLIALVVLLVGCNTDVPQNTFDAQGDVARKQRDIFYYALWPAVAILVIVEGLLLFALLRFRQRRGQALPKQVHGNTRLEIAWTIAPAILIIALGGLMTPIIIDLAAEAKADALQVRVTARQWEWEFEYLDPEFEAAEPNPQCVAQQLRAPQEGEGYPLCTVRELHVPVGRDIAIELESIDVIHSFWVPKLAGKLDAIPGRTNEMWFNATAPGDYSGQCAEFCGLGHAQMRLIVIAESEEDFQAWIEEQLAARSGAGQSSLAELRE